MLREVDCRGFQRVWLYVIGDVHIGDTALDDTLLYEDLRRIKDNPAAKVVLNGDIMDCATIHSKGNTYKAKHDPQEQIKTAARLFGPIADKIIAINNGNHERRIRKESGVDVSEILAALLKVPYTGTAARLKFLVGKRTKYNGKPAVYTAYITHGFGAGRVVNGKLNQCVKIAEHKMYDVIILNHVHQGGLLPLPVVDIPDPRTGKERRLKRLGISNSGYLGLAEYAEEMGMPETSRYLPDVVLDAESGIECSWRIRI